MRINLLFVFIGALFLVGCTGEVETSLDMYLQVSNYTGVNVDSDALYFGTIDFEKPGMVERTIELRNDGDLSHDYFVRVRGDLSKYSVISSNDFRLKSGEQKDITVKVMTGELSKGNYTGELIIYRK